MATLGCKVNQAETETVAAGLARAGFRRVEFGEVADVYVINTCTVTHIADRKSRQLVRQARRLNVQALVVATGCYAEVAAEELAAVGGVDMVVGNTEKHRLAELIAGACPEVSARLPVPGQVGGRTRAFVKVQSGCDNHCTYCIVPRARGPQRSEPADAVLASAAGHVVDGYREIVLTGVHVGAYGRDFAATVSDQSLLPGLLRRLLVETQVERLRLSSLEPDDLSPELIALWPAFGERLCRHFHLPLQSGSDTVLRRMGRRYTTSDYARLVEELRQRVSGVAVTADIMVGFPGETDEEHRQSRDFARAIAFAGLHVFKYSPRPGTPATRLPGRVSPSVARERSAELIAGGQVSAAAFRRGFVGQQLSVLFESEEGAGESRRWTGLSDNYVRAYAASAQDLHNQLRAVRVVGEREDGLAVELT
ncbi:MAG: tRNA (N(6)-L-threonylcarbamoyladenosine(37)-C(2))-methylthiotransferase MtaB [Chloroflexota bacterium]